MSRKEYNEALEAWAVIDEVVEDRRNRLEGGSGLSKESIDKILAPLESYLQKLNEQLNEFEANPEDDTK